MELKKQDVVYVLVDNKQKRDIEVLLSVNGVPYKFMEFKDVYILTEDEIKEMLMDLIVAEITHPEISAEQFIKSITV